MKNIVTVLGARPQFVKAAVVSRAITAHGGMSESILHTGQHYDASMSDVFFDELRIPAPKWNLSIGSGPHGRQTGRMIEGIESILLQEKPDLVLVYGDTNSTLAGALASIKLRIPIAHVEAGLRSFNPAMPEETNRILTDRISSLLFAPSRVAVEHLAREGTNTSKIVLTGDVMYDAILTARKVPRSARVQSLKLEDRPFFLVTVHRAENTDDPVRIKNIMLALSRLQENYRILFPVHPRTKEKLWADLSLRQLMDSIEMLEPLGYMDMIQVEKSAALILTDSGGIQKEAYFVGVPCVTLRTETEWTETVEAGWNRLASLATPESIVDAAMNAIGTRGKETPLYGNGDSSNIIARSLSEFLKLT